MKYILLLLLSCKNQYTESIMLPRMCIYDQCHIDNIYNFPVNCNVNGKRIYLYPQQSYDYDYDAGGKIFCKKRK